MSDLLTIGKVWELGQRPRHKPRTDPYDLVILDAPASGQLVGLLAAPRTFREIARVGPVAGQAGRIERAIADEADVGAVVVATPEQMAVTEALGLQAALSGRFGIELEALVVNRLLPARFSPEDGLALAGAPDDPAIRSARWFHARAQAQKGELERLVGQLPDVPCITLPFGFEAELGRAHIEHLADLLAGRTDELLTDPASAFAIVTSPERVELEEALFFAAELDRLEMHRAAVIVNRVHPRDVTDPDVARTVARLTPLLGSSLAQRAARTHAQVQRLALRDAAAIARMRSALHAEPVSLADRPSGVHDIPGLVGLYDELFERDDADGTHRQIPPVGSRDGEYRRRQRG